MMREILNGIAIIVGLGLFLIATVAFIHAHGPVNRPLPVPRADISESISDQIFGLGFDHVEIEA